MQWSPLYDCSAHVPAPTRPVWLAIAIPTAHVDPRPGPTPCFQCSPGAADDLRHLQRAAEVSQQPLGETQPHPYAGCVLVSAAGVPLAEAAHRAQGTEAAEVLAARAAGEAAAGGTAYLNLECGDCHGERAAVDALVRARLARVVVGMRHPLPHLRGAAVAQLRAAGLRVDVLGEARCAAPAEDADAALDACLAANQALLHRAVLRRPLGLLKYAMTLDGKIATHTGHSAWVSSPQSRQRVFEARAASDAVIVGGCTGALLRGLMVLPAKHCGGVGTLCCVLHMQRCISKSTCAA